jgi:ubiquinone biosynthesis protein
MLTAEGIGRTLAPNVNMWELARPLIEKWVYDNIGPEAQIKRHFKKTVKLADSVPSLISNMNNVVKDTYVGGIKIHPDTVRTMIEANTEYVACEKRKRPNMSALLPWAIICFLLYRYVGF